MSRLIALNNNCSNLKFQFRKVQCFRFDINRKTNFTFTFRHSISEINSRLDNKVRADIEWYHALLLRLARRKEVGLAVCVQHVFASTHGARSVGGDAPCMRNGLNVGLCGHLIVVLIRSCFDNFVWWFYVWMICRLIFRHYFAVLSFWCLFSDFCSWWSARKEHHHSLLYAWPEGSTDGHRQVWTYSNGNL